MLKVEPFGDALLNQIDVINGFFDGSAHGERADVIFRETELFPGQ